MATLTQTPTRPKPAPAQVRRDGDTCSAPPAEKPVAPTIDRVPSRPRPEFPEPYKFDVHQYHAMAEAGILAPDDRVELIDGVIVAMSGIGPEHIATVDSSAEFWMDAMNRRVIVRIQGAIRLDERNEPQPDIALLKRRADFYRSRMAGPSVNRLD